VTYFHFLFNQNKVKWRRWWREKWDW